MVRFTKIVNDVEFEEIRHECPCCGDVLSEYVPAATVEEIRHKPVILCDVSAEFKRRISSGLCDTCHTDVCFDNYFYDDVNSIETADELVCV